jgi:hypothetical protein
MCDDFAPNFVDKRTGCCITTTSRLTLLLSPAIFFIKNNITVVPHPTYFALFPRLKIKLKGRHFDTTEVLEAESQAVLDTLTEHDFQDAFKNVRSAGSSACPRNGTTSRVMMASRPKV